MRSFSIIIPVYRDLKYIKGKIGNILDLKYNSKMVEVILVHGGAQNDRVQNLRETDPLAKIVHLKISGKISQINAGMSQAYGDIILVTDIDARMEPNCLLEIDKAFEDPGVMVVGAWTYPENCTIVEKAYWKIANHIRLWETRFKTCSHVTGCCLAFRASLLTSFPEDVIADDVYVPFLANFTGTRTVYLRTTKVTEIRQPTSYFEFLRHKQRKGNAFLRELLRFMYLLYAAPWKWKLIYLARLFQFTVLTPTVFLSYLFYRQDSKYRKVK